MCDSPKDDGFVTELMLLPINLSTNINTNIDSNLANFVTDKTTRLKQIELQHFLTRQSLQNSLHNLLKRFMNSSLHPSAVALRAEYNEKYPSTWEEVEGWRDGEGWGRVYGLYVVICDGGSASSLFPEINGSRELSI